MNAKNVELHLLQSFPPACLNRDGANAPKDCVFGDVRRARISSQCLKRAIRQADIFAETMGEAVATRSKQMRDMKLIPYLLEAGLSQEEAEAAADAFRKELAKDDKKPERTSVGLYFGDSELFALLDAHRAGDKSWKTAASKKSADVALFGRMLAEAADLNVDAASQVAHAIGTHRLTQERDYWTAADDLNREDDPGAGMMGEAGFNASHFYRYACVSLPILRANLGDEGLAKTAIEAFLRASWDAIPTGKINGHAHFVPPFSAMAVVRRKGMPMNLCNAFNDPIRAGKAPMDRGSHEALGAYLKRARGVSPHDDADYFLTHMLDDTHEWDNVQHVPSYEALIQAVLAKL